MKSDLLLFSVEIKVKKEIIKKINSLFAYNVKVLKQDEEFFYLKILEKDLVKLDQLHIPYTVVSYRGIKHILKHFITHMSVMIGIIIFLLIIYINSISIKEISFSTYTKDNDRIEAIIDDHLSSVYNFKYLDGNLNDLNLLLRKEFSNYEWISVQKKGCVLEVTILEPNVINNQIEHIEGYGDLVAKKDGMVKFYQVRQGIPVIEYNQYVKKGQLLVSGNLRYNNQDESEFYIPANGKVYAEVWYTKTIEVPKKSTVTEYTGKISTDKSLDLFGLYFKYKSGNSSYKQYDKETKIDHLELFSIKLPIGIKKVQYLEKNDIMYIYDSKTAYEYATSQIKYQLSRSFSKGDKIEQISLLTQSEDDDKFTYVFFVKTYENIAIFQRRAVNE